MEKKAIKFTKGSHEITHFYRIDEKADRVDVATEENGKMLDECFFITVSQYLSGLEKYEKDGYTATDITDKVFNKQ